MKYLPTFVSVVALLWAAAMTLRCGRLPWVVSAYVIAQCAFALVAFLGLQRTYSNTRGYAGFFAIAFGLVLLTGLGFIYTIARQHPAALGVTLVVSAAAHAAAIAAIVYYQIHKVHHGVPVPLSIAIFQGAVLAFYGSVALISLAVPLTPEMRTATLALGGFWIALGILSFAWAIGVVRHPAMWLTLNNFLPAMLAIVAFGWMAFQLGKLQAETSRAVAEPIRFEGAVEVQQ